MGLSYFAKHGDKVLIDKEAVERRHKDMNEFWMAKMRELYDTELTLKSSKDRYGKPSEDTNYWGLEEVDDFLISASHLISV